GHCRARICTSFNINVRHESSRHCYGNGQAIRMDESARLRLFGSERRKGQRGGMGSRNDEPESSARIRLDAEYGETRRHHFVHRWCSQERRAVDDQLVYETGRRPDDEVLERIKV